MLSLFEPLMQVLDHLLHLVDSPRTFLVTVFGVWRGLNDHESLLRKCQRECIVRTADRVLHVLSKFVELLEWIHGSSVYPNRRPSRDCAQCLAILQ